MHPLSLHPWSKSGLLIGVIIGAALVTHITDALNSMTVRDMWFERNKAAVIESIKRDNSLARTVELLPLPGSSIGTSEIFSWNPVAGASDYILLVGTYKGGANIDSVITGNDTLAVIDNIPQTGERIYVRISYILNGQEEHFDTEYLTEKASTDETSVAPRVGQFDPLPKAKSK